MMRPDGGFFARHGALVAVAGFGAAMAVASLLPVYTDEIGWRFQERAGYAPGLDTMYGDLCGPETLARPPWFMMPARGVSAFLNGLLPDPLFIRCEGVALALMFAVLLWRLAKAAGPGPAGSDLRAIGFSLLGMGMLPMLMAMSRPEQPLILATTAAILVALRGGHSAQGASRNAGIIVVLAIVALSCHLKGVLYSPVFACCLATCGRGRGTGLPRLAGLAGLAILTLVAARYWVLRFDCPGNAVIAAKLAQQNAAARLAGVQGLGDLGALLMGANPFEYVLLAGPQPHPMSDWVPAGLVSHWLALGFAVMLTLAWGAALGLALMRLGRFCLRARRGALAEPRALLAVALIAVVLVWGASQTAKNVYEASHVLPLLAVAIILALSLPGRGTGPGVAAARRLAKGLPGVALVAQVLIAALYAPALLAANAVPGPVPGQPFSLSLRGYGQVRADIEQAMQGAGIASGPALHRPLLDDTTYLALQHATLPFHALGVIRVWHDRSIEPAGYLLSRRSAGIVVGCGMLPDHLVRIAVRRDTICAIGPGALAGISRKSYPPPEPLP